MIYGTAAAVEDLLSSDGTAEVWTPAQEARMVALLQAASGLIEEATGCVFDSAQPETIEFVGEGDDTLYLDKAIRTVTSIVEAPATWNGTTWTGGTTLAASDYRLLGRDVKRITETLQSVVYHKIVRVDGGWPFLTVITGLWEDQVPDVPDDITYLANRAAAEIFKTEKGSPAGFVGVEGALIPVRDFIKTSSEWRGIVDRWAVGRIAVMV